MTRHVSAAEKPIVSDSVGAVDDRAKSADETDVCITATDINAVTAELSKRLGDLETVFCSIEITGLRPLILSTSGLSRFPIKLLAYAEKLSIYRRCPSA